MQRKISRFTPTFTQRIELPYQYNNFSIEFATLTYKNPELNRYAYQLEGFDKNWVYTNSNRRFAYYNNLKSGTYTFRLKATDENGIWSGYIRELSVVILPPVLGNLVGVYLVRTVCCRNGFLALSNHS